MGVTGRRGSGARTRRSVDVVAAASPEPESSSVGSLGNLLANANAIVVANLPVAQWASALRWPMALVVDLCSVPLSRRLVAFFPGGGDHDDEEEYGNWWASGQVVVGSMAGHEHPAGKERALEAIMDESVPKRGRRVAEAAAAAAGPALVGSVRSIPDDILLFHILVLLPVKCLVRFQSVCKLWRATIRSAPFVRRQLEVSRATRPSSMVLVPLNSPVYRAAGVSIYRFEPGQSKVAELMLDKEVASGVPAFSIPLHCDGLVLIPCTTGHVFVCNPATGEFVELPPPLMHVPSLEHRAAFAFDPWSGTYKVGRPFVRSYREIQVDERRTIAECSIGHEIFTIGDPSGTWSWKETMDPPYPIKPRTPICLPGVFYWSGVKSKGHGLTDDLDVILRFSLQDERFTVHPNPPCSGFLSIYDWLCELGGKLCYLHSSQFEVDIWLAEDGPDLTWSLWCSISLPVPSYHDVLACVSADKEKIFLSIDACYLLIGDLRARSLVKMIDIPYEVVYDNRNGSRFTTVGLLISHFMVSFVESLVRIRT